MTKRFDQEGSSDAFHHAMEEALEHLDQLKSELSAEQQKAIDRQHAADAELNRIRSEADEIMHLWIEQKRSGLENQIRNEVLYEVVCKLVVAGIPSDQLKIALELTPELLAKVWHHLRFERINGQYVGHVGYAGNSQSGEVIFYRNDRLLKFPYTAGSKDVLVVIEVPSPDQWPRSTGLNEKERDQILAFIGRRVVEDQAPGGSYQVFSDRIEISVI